MNKVPPISGRMYKYYLKCACRLPQRTLHSTAGSWPNTFSKDLREELEEHWLDKLKDQHVHHMPSSQEAADKYYVLSMFPYPSGKLHMGHVRVYTISDIMARYHRLCSKHVVHPMGWDSFGLPAENAAIERNEKPSTWTLSNIEAMRKQLHDLCLSFDWDRELATCDPKYYRWTQYIFLKMYEAGLAYQKEGAVNWDPVDQTVLADEQIDEDGCSWRSGAKAEKRHLKQWYIKTTAFSKALIDGLKEVNPDLWKDIMQLQRNWIGKCDGARFEFPVECDGQPLGAPLSLFTRHPECIYGASHILLSPEHAFNKQQYYKNSEATGPLIELRVDVRHPLTGIRVPTYVSTEHDFGSHLDSHLAIPDCSDTDRAVATSQRLAWVKVIDGEKLVNSQQFSGMARKEAFTAITNYAKEINCGGDVTSEVARDWLISRQRYWGTPIPMVHCPKYGTMPVPEEDLPVLLPELDELTGRGGSPLATLDNWVKVKCPKCDCDGYATRETDTMDTFVDSSWYFLRYLDPGNTAAPFSAELVRRLMPVDLYIGGKEHATMHLYYARFFQHFLHGAGLVPQREPFINLLTQGMVMGRSYRLKDSGKYIPESQVDFSGSEPVERDSGEPLLTDWEKMSKSKYNGVDPQEVLDEFGCDATRLCIVFNVAPKSDRQWSKEAFVGVLRWQTRVWSLVSDYRDHVANDRCTDVTDTELAEVEQDIFEIRNYFLKEIIFHMNETFILSVALSRLQGLSNALKRVPGHVAACSEQYERALADLLIMIAPFAPMFASELWNGMAAVPKHRTKHYDWSKEVFQQRWPSMDPDYKLSIKVKVDGRAAFKVPLPMSLEDSVNLGREEAYALVTASPLLERALAAKPVLGYSFAMEPGIRVEVNLKTKVKKKKKTKQQSAAESAS